MEKNPWARINNKRKSIPTSSHSLFIPPTSSWQPILYFLCLHLSIWDSSYQWNCVLRGLLCLRLSLSKTFWKLIQVVAHEYLFLFLAEEHCYLWVVSTFWILGIKLMWTFIYIGSCMNMCFPQQLHHCTFWPACLRVPFFLHSCQPSLFSVIFIIVILWVWRVSQNGNPQFVDVCMIYTKL